MSANAVSANVAVADAVLAKAVGPVRTGRRRRVLVTGLGVGLIWGALGLAGYATGWQTHRRQATHTLLASQRQARAATHGQPCVVASPTTGQLAGTLRIPALHLTAPVEEGTADTQLAVAVGHDATSVWPGQSGTAVFLAHDVSYFVHLGQLQAGDQVVYQTACNTVTYTVTEQQVVTQGAAVGDSRVADDGPRHLLPAERAVLHHPATARDRDRVDRSGPFDRRLAGALAAGPGVLRRPGPARPGRPGADAGAERGADGHDDAGGPDGAGLGAVAGSARPGGRGLGGLLRRAPRAADQRSDWWSAIATGPMPGPLAGATVTGHDSPLDVEIDSTDGAVSQVVLRTTVTLAGGAAPGTYAETVTTPVQGSTVRIGTWTLVPA